MGFFEYGGSPIKVPARITDAHRRTWGSLARPGRYWPGAERVAIAEHVRRAERCRYCAARKALSMESVLGAHDGGGALPRAAVEAVHRIVGDPRRLDRAWFESLLEAGLGEGAYAELVGVVTSVLSIDEVHRGLGLPLEPLPEAEEGSPSGRRPSGARREGSWVATVPPAGLEPEDADIYEGMSQVANVRRALSLAPNEVRILSDLHRAHYVPMAEMRNMGWQRGLSRQQVELVAARVSAVNECFY